MTGDPIDGSGVTGPPVQARRVGPGGSMASDNAFAIALLTLWQQVSEAGGAVGFVPPVDRAAVGAAVAGVIQELRSGAAHAFALTRGRQVIGFAELRPGVRTQAHTGVVVSVMVEPASQHLGLGRLLIESVLELAGTLGLERLWLGVRGGEGLEPFYQQFGFRESGRLPGWIRVGPGDDRDEVLMVLDRVPAAG